MSPPNAKRFVIPHLNAQAFGWVDIAGAMPFTLHVDDELLKRKGNSELVTLPFAATTTLLRLP